jgi:hypothetical protein
MSTRLVMLAIGALMAAGALPAAAEDTKAPWRIELREQARAQGHSLTLGDVADLRTRDLAGIRALVGLPLVTHLRPGRQVIVTRDAIQRAVEPLAAKAGAPVTLSGAERVQAERASQTVDGERIATVARDALARALVSQLGAADVALVRPPRDIVLPAGELSVVPRVVLGPTDWLRRASVWVQLHVDGRLETAVPVDFQIEGVTALLPTARPVGLLASTGSVQPALPAARHPENRQAAIAAPDATLAVQRGRTALLRSASGPIALEVQVQVLQDGRIGETVRVQAPAGTGPVLARVLSDGLLEMTQ